MKTDCLVYSFYTSDDYYTSKAKELANQLDTLGIDCLIEPIEIPPGKDWSDICRQKISKLYTIRKSFPNKKIFWIDVDCNLNDLPNYVVNFSSDIIGFARGFSSPLKVGYHLRSRFWEPCFIGLNCTPAAFKFIEDAALIEKTFSEKATDDYFFEESWRRNCDFMSYQIIPSYELDKGEGRGFFKFGSSGHVKEFAGKVVQHEKLFDVVSSYKGWSKKILKTLGLLEIARDLNQIRISWLSKYARKYGTLGRNLYIEGLYECFKNNDKQLFEELKKRETNFSGSDKQDLNSFAESVFEYQNFQDFSNAIPLCWYPFPAPGNYGDWLSPYVLSRVTGRSVKFIPFKQLSSFKQKNLLFIGSIIKFANDCSVVFGSGASRTNTKINTKAKYVSVRGDLTKRLLLQSGITLPNDFSVGDPAIVLPLIYPSKRSKNGRLALVRHFSHRCLQLELPEGVDEISILRSSAQDIEEFIDILNTYSGVLTSAMHCYITCQAYGIPCAFVSWQAGEGKIAGDGMKYLDYATGVDMPPIVTHNLPQNMKAEVDLYSLLSFNKINNDKIIDVYNKIKELSQLFDSNAL